MQWGLRPFSAAEGSLGILRWDDQDCSLHTAPFIRKDVEPGDPRDNSRSSGGGPVKMPLQLCQGGVRV